MRPFVKSGYSLCTKHLFTQPSTSRILYNCTLDKSYGTSKTLQTHPHHCAIVLGPIHAKQWKHNGATNLVTINQRYLFTSLPPHGQAALKPKSPGSNDKRKELKDKEKTVAANKSGNRSKNDVEETAAQKAAEKTAEQSDSDVPEIEEKLSLTAKFKKMYKEYWYVLLPVHIFTSTFWFAGFYYMSTRCAKCLLLYATLQHFYEMKWKWRCKNLSFTCFLFAVV